MSSPAPVGHAERISAIDSLRGFALLGILLMNIVGMGLHSSAYDNPTVAGGATGPDLWVWIVMHVLAEGKMRCLFSLVFGSSAILLLSRLEGRSEAADIYYRRTFWLMAFGVAHAYLLWSGDILYPYALCGLLLYPFRNLKPKSLILIGSALLVIDVGLYISEALDRRDTLEKGKAAVQAAARGAKLTEEQEEAKGEYELWLKRTHPTPTQLKKTYDEWRGNPWQVIKARAKDVAFWHRLAYYSWYNFDVWGMMFLGMGLIKIGVTSGARPPSFYRWCILAGYGIGIPLNSYTAWLLVRSQFDPVVSNLTGSAYDIGRLTVALGHLGVIMLMCKNDGLRWLTGPLAAIGQTAFSNYIFQSAATAFLFTGYGFKLYGALQRRQLYYVVAGIWIVQWFATPFWVRRYRFGPLEWCWRSLTYWKKQPMRLNSRLTVQTAPQIPSGD